MRGLPRASSLPEANSAPAMSAAGTHSNLTEIAGPGCLGPPDSNTDLSIVIVSWNARKYVAECLDSLQSANGTSSVEIIVVDNASNDGTADLVRDRFPQVRLVETGGNIGFSRGNNVGVRLAKGKYICLINPDVNIPPDCLHKMYSFMEQNPEIGLLGPKMLAANGLTARSGMRFPTLWNVFLRAIAADGFLRGSSTGNWLMTDFQFDRTRDMDVLNGWFWMARREAVNEVGLLDEDFFMYAEDLDWCKRFHSHKWRVVFYSEAEAVHYGGGCSSNDPLRFSVEQQRANMQYWAKYHNRASLLLYAIAVWFGHAMRMVGWTAIGAVKPSERAKARFEAKRNLECIRWMLAIPTIKPIGTLDGKSKTEATES